MGQPHAQPADVSRIETFSDGVLAIAITLLALELRVPSASDLVAAGGFWGALGKNWPSYLAYVLSFLRIGVAWVNHHDSFRIIRRVDRPVMLLNLLLLLLIGAVPFSTDILAEHLEAPQAAAGATILYGSLQLAIGVALNVLWIYATKHPELMAHELGEAEQSNRLRHNIAGSIALLVALGMAFVDVWISLGLQVAAAVLQLALIPRWPDARGG